jgi:hypothetical protein
VPSRWKPLSCSSVHNHATDPVESEPGEPMIVELRWATIGHINAQTNSVVPRRTSPASSVTRRTCARVAAETRRSAARSAGALEPTSTSCAAITSTPITTFVQTTPSRLEGMTASPATWKATAAPTIHA